MTNDKGTLMTGRRAGFSRRNALLLIGQYAGIAGWGLCQKAEAQVPAAKTTPASEPALPGVPAPMRRVAEAMGSRFTSAGEERLVMAADRGKGAAAVIFENPRKFRYQEADKLITYDGATVRISGNKDAGDDAFLESFFEDYFDGMFFNLTSATFYRFLMTRARLDDGKAKDYSGPYLDVHQIRMPVPSITGSPTRVKHYYFDSKTLLLDRVRYHGTDGKTRVETSFQNWTKVNDSFAPSSVVRKENETVQFTVKLSGWQLGPAGNTSDFKG